MRGKSLVHRCIMHVCGAGKEPFPHLGASSSAQVLVLRTSFSSASPASRCGCPASGSERGPGQRAMAMAAQQFREVAQLAIQCLGFAVVFDGSSIGHAFLVLLPATLVAHAFY